MQYKRFNDKYVLRVDKGEEVVETITTFCEDKNIRLASISGIGATNNATIVLFESGKKLYHKETFADDMEILSLTGNISTKDDKPYIHLHIILSTSDHKAIGGHLNSAIISVTCEIVLTIIGTGETVYREFNEEIGLNLFKF